MENRQGLYFPTELILLLVFNWNGYGNECMKGLDGLSFFVVTIGNVDGVVLVAIGIKIYRSEQQGRRFSFPSFVFLEGF